MDWVSFLRNLAGIDLPCIVRMSNGYVTDPWNVNFIRFFLEQIHDSNLCIMPRAQQWPGHTSTSLWFFLSNKTVARRGKVWKCLLPLHLRSWVKSSDYAGTLYQIWKVYGIKSVKKCGYCNYYSVSGCVSVAYFFTYRFRVPKNREKRGHLFANVS